MPVETIKWVGALDGHVEIVDQTRLPCELVYQRCDTAESIWHAIRTLQVRGAPAIGVAAAMGLVLGVRNYEGAPGSFLAELRRVRDYLAFSRPTAVNLTWALDRMVAVAASSTSSSTSSTMSTPLDELKLCLLEEALRIATEDRDVCRRIGANGAALLKDGDVVLTHCNAGALATAGHGTALGVLFTAHEQGKRVSVYVDETRPLLQGARLTAWELVHAGIPATLICDNMAAHVMRERGVTAVIVGADRIAANGDTANKIGTYGLSVLAKAHGIPFYVAAPVSTFDLSIPDGGHIPIEQRGPEEITHWGDRIIAPEGIAVYNPAFDVTPAGNITAIITERGVIERPDRAAIAAIVGMPAEQ